MYGVADKNKEKFRSTYPNRRIKIWRPPEERERVKAIYNFGIILK
jgi:hypothetical protein